MLRDDIRIDALLASLPRMALIVGKGGVGKSTAAAALAIAAADRGQRTLLITTDPAHALGRVLDAEIGASPTAVAGVDGLEALQPDVTALRDAFLARWREVLVTIVDRGTYLERDDIRGIVDAALPGSDEIFALLELAHLARDERYARIVIDTAPTGHTLRLLALPRAFDALLDLLDTMQEKHRFMVRTLTRRYQRDAADAFIAEMRAEVRSLGEAFADRTRAAAVVITRSEPLVAAETRRLIAALTELRVAIAACITNAEDEAQPCGHAPSYAVPRLEQTPIGVEGLRRWGDRLSGGGRREAGAGRRDARADSGDVRLPASDTRWLRALTIVAGKGGVGKTTVACALAVDVAGPERRVLIVSTDPAPSVGDALDVDVGDAVTPIRDRPGLFARQADAAAAFARFRDEYRARIDATLDSILASGVDVAHDRAVLRDLLSLAPPGIDELYGLATLGELIEAGEYETVIVDPAPTGHLLRLLELPALAIDWARRVMRLMLKYPELGASEEVGNEVLGFTRRTRALLAILHDDARAGVITVAIDEPVVRGETERLVAAVTQLGVPMRAVLWNRTTTRSVEPLSSETPLVQLLAPERTPAPRGVSALGEWAATWTEL